MLLVGIVGWGYANKSCVSDDVNVGIHGCEYEMRWDKRDARLRLAEDDDDEPVPVDVDYKIPCLNATFRELMARERDGCRKPR